MKEGICHAVKKLRGPCGGWQVGRTGSLEPGKHGGRGGLLGPGSCVMGGVRRPLSWPTRLGILSSPPR